MADKEDFLEIFKPFSIPIGIALSAFGLYQTYSNKFDELQILILIGITLLVSLLWAVWYVLAKTKNLSVIDQQLILTEFKYKNKILRRLVFAVPVLCAILLVFLSINYRSKVIYSKMLEGGGPFTPIVVLDSKPRGATVRIAKIYYGDDDPYLRDKNNKNIFEVPNKTLTRVKLYQGQYWVVFEYKGKSIGRTLTLQDSQVLKVTF
ncbi:MAG TPA: hypothetical protein VI298_01850 [Geobacteraceae bacterium]